MRNHLRKLLCLVCALYLSGAHWALLQTAAWTGMLVTRAQEGSLTKAVATTFDGAHPCDLCAKISQGQEREQEKLPAPVLKKTDDLKIVAQAQAQVPAAELAGELSWPTVVLAAERRADAPPTPIPLA